MSSNFERKSLEDLKEQSRRQIKAAAEAVPCLTVTEKNWLALVGLQRTQIQLLIDVQEATARLATKEEVEEYLSLQGEQMKKLSTVLFWVTLIPSAALVILELISHIFPLIL